MVFISIPETSFELVLAGGCFSNQGSNGGQSSNAGSKNNCNNSMGGSCKV